MKATLVKMEVGASDSRCMKDVSEVPRGANPIPRLLDDQTSGVSFGLKQVSLNFMYLSSQAS